MWADACMHAHPKGHGWEREPRDERLEQLAWTFHRAWVDRYGWRATNRRSD